MDLCQDPEPLIRQFQGFDDVVMVNRSIEGNWDRNGIVWVGAEFKDHITLVVTVERAGKTVSIPAFGQLVADEKLFWNLFLRRWFLK